MERTKSTPIVETPATSDAMTLCAHRSAVRAVSASAVTGESTAVAWRRIVVQVNLLNLIIYFYLSFMNFNSDL